MDPKVDLQKGDRTAGGMTVSKLVSRYERLSCARRFMLLHSIDYRDCIPFARPNLAVGETVILLYPPLSLVGVSIGINRGCHQNDRTLANGCPNP